MKLPTLFNDESWISKGGLATYGPNYTQMGRHAAELIDKLLKGAQPKDVPVQSASKFDLLINLRTANAIGLNIATGNTQQGGEGYSLTMADLADTFRTIPLFSGLSREDIAKVLGKLEEKSFPPGATIMSQGDKGDSFYFIQSGAVQVVLESPGATKESIAVLGPQDWFGEMALLSGEPRSATIITVKDTTVWRLSREAWDELIEKHSTWLFISAPLEQKACPGGAAVFPRTGCFQLVSEEFYTRGGKSSSVSFAEPRC